MNNNSLVSVVVNCFNGEKFIDKCITSILNQTYKNFEIIFWNNKSNDNSLSILNKYTDPRIRLYDSDIHTNISVARNEAIKKTTGEYICFIDVDDYWSKNKLEEQIKNFYSEKIGVSFTNFWYVKIQKNLETKKPISLKFEEGLTNKIIKKYEIVLSTIMIRKKILEDHKIIFNEKYHIISDFDFILKLSLLTKFYHLKDFLTYRTWHGINESIKKRENAVYEMEDWLKKNTYTYKNYFKEISFLKNKVFYDNINFKIKKKKIFKAILFFLKSNLNQKINYFKSLYSNLIN